MKALRTQFRYFILLVFIIVGCKKSAEDNVITNALTAAADTTGVDTLVVNSPNKGKPTPLDTTIFTKAIRFVRVVATRATLKEKPDENSNTIQTISRDGSFPVLETTGDWYRVLVYIDNRLGTAFINAGEVIDELDLPFEPAWNKEVDRDVQEEEISSVVEVEPVSKEEYFRMEQKALIHFKVKDVSVYNEPADFSLTIAGRQVHFEGKPKSESGDPEGEIQYLGYSASLEAHLVESAWYEAESTDYTLHDAVTGHSMEFPSFPKFSADKKWVICLSHNAYNDVAELNLYQIKNDSLKHYAIASFTDWIPVENVVFNHHYGFWGTDNWYYQAVLPPNAFWQRELYPGPAHRYTREYLDAIYNFRYIRLK